MRKYLLIGILLMLTGIIRAQLTEIDMGTGAPASGEKVNVAFPKVNNVIRLLNRLQLYLDSTNNLERKILDGALITTGELNRLVGVTAPIQTQINAKADTSLSNLSSVAINTHLLPGTDGAVNLGSATKKFGDIHQDSAKVWSWNNGDITATHSDNTLTFAGGNIVLPSTTSIGSVSSTELGYVNNVTSAIQTQINDLKSTFDSIVLVLADTVNIETLLQIDFDTDTLADLSELRLKLNRADTLYSDNPSYYTQRQVDSLAATIGGGVTISDVRDEIADSLNVLRPLKLNLADSSAVAEPGHYATGNMLEDGLATKLGIGETAASVTGFTPASGSLTLSGADALTLTTSAETNVTLPTTGTLATTTQVALKADLTAVRLLVDTIPIFIFGGGGGNAGDTTTFTTSTIYGSFYNTGSDTLVITQLKCIMLGEAGDTLGVDINWSDTLQAVIPTELNTTPHPFGYTSSGKVGSTDTSFNNTKIPPNKWVWCDTPFISAGHKPKYFNAQISGYKIPKY